MENSNKPSNLQVLSGAVVLSLGFTALIMYSWAWWALCLGGLLGWIIVFKRDGLKPFKLPKRIWIIFIAIFDINT